MVIPTKYDFGRYLAAKKRIDDGALNRNVLDKLRAQLRQTNTHSPLRVLELGAGIGTMVERLVDWGLLTSANYTAIDADQGLLREAYVRLNRWAAGRDFKSQGHPTATLKVEGPSGQLSLNFECADIERYFEKSGGDRQWDFGLAHAFMDLVNPADVVPRFCKLIRPGGLLYLTLNYDGETILLPSIDRELEKRVMQLYNQSMDDRVIHGKKAGDSQTGRHLLLHLKNSGAEILAAGSSDWVVFPRSDGYNENESYFLHFIVHTIFKELKGHDSLDRRKFGSWVAQRHSQIEKGELIFIAKQMDVLARISAASVSKIRN